METVNRLIELLNSITTSTGLEYHLLYSGDGTSHTLELISESLESGDYKDLIKATSSTLDHLEAEFPKLVAQIISLKL